MQYAYGEYESGKKQEIQEGVKIHVSSKLVETWTGKYTTSFFLIDCFLIYLSSPFYSTLIKKLILATQFNSSLHQYNNFFLLWYYITIHSLLLSSFDLLLTFDFHSACYEDNIWIGHCNLTMEKKALQYFNGKEREHQQNLDGSHHNLTMVRQKKKNSIKNFMEIINMRRGGIIDYLRNLIGLKKHVSGKIMNSQIPAAGILSPKRMAIQAFFYLGIGFVELQRISTEVRTKLTKNQAKLVPNLQTKHNRYQLREIADLKKKHFTAAQEACLQDIEKVFCSLQSKWHILTSAVQLRYVYDIHYIFFCCIILYKIMVEEVPATLAKFFEACRQMAKTSFSNRFHELKLPCNFPSFLLELQLAALNLLFCLFHFFLDVEMKAQVLNLKHILIASNKRQMRKYIRPSIKKGDSKPFQRKNKQKKESYIEGKGTFIQQKKWMFRLRFQSWMSHTPPQKGRKCVQIAMLYPVYNTTIIPLLNPIKHPQTWAIHICNLCL
ncbi:hypothetical protein VP01_2472g1 [Puccinia sorghi]|uniref:Uncharacterized protein n=1 Tax=Puccinia sorghi TaxID=27349 RepID=A0A0L6V605_9BASI|nr:hypothetical protein VP01_2472g1 [Puccinia sorghi]